MSVTAKPHIFLFSGNDSYSISEKVRLWRTEFEKKYGASNCALVDCEQLSEQEARSVLMTLLHASTLFSATKLVILKNIFSKGTKKIVLETLAQELESTPPTHFIVLHDDRTDARTAFYKTLKKLSELGRAQIQEFTLPRGRDLTAWVQQYSRTHAIQIEAGALDEFVRRFDAAGFEQQSWQSESAISWNLWQVTHELEKLIAYTQGRIIMKDDVRTLLSDNPDAHVFSLVDALAMRDKNTARRLATLLANEGAQAKSGILGMTALLQGQFRSFLIIKESQDAHKSESEIADRLSWNPRRLWVVSKKIQRLNTDTIRSVYRALLDLEHQLKSSSANPLMLIERIIQTL